MRYNYNENQFYNSVCNACNICGPKQQLATFCYDLMYRQDSEAFMDKALPSLLKLRGDWEEGPSYLDEMTRFMEVFCEAGMCGTSKDLRDDCPHISDCYTDFKEQLDANQSSNLAPSEQDDGEFFENAWDTSQGKYFPMAPTSQRLSKKQIRKEKRAQEQLARSKAPKIKLPPKVKPIPTCFFFCRTPELWKTKEAYASNNI
jgi:hypothetical protein